MTMITGTRSESTVIELDDLYQLFIIDAIMAVTKYSKQPTKLSTKKSPKLRTFDRLKRMTTFQSRACQQRGYSQS